MKLLIGAGGNVSEQDANGASPLAIAAFCGHYEMVALLLTAPGIELECKDSTQATPLWLAAANGKDETVQILIEAGADQAVRNADG